jgi:hypothetical protein
MKLRRWFERQFSYEAKLAHNAVKRASYRQQAKRLSLDQLHEQSRLLDIELARLEHEGWIIERLAIGVIMSGLIAIASVAVSRKVVVVAGAINIILTVLVVGCFIRSMRARGRHKAQMRAVENWPKEELIDAPRYDG